MKIYCQNCGKPTEYTAMNKPNFCFNCGSAFGGGGVSNAAQAQPEAQVLSRDGLEDEDEVSSVPNLGKLLVDIDVERASFDVGDRHRLRVSKGDRRCGQQQKASGEKTKSTNRKGVGCFFLPHARRLSLLSLRKTSHAAAQT